MAQPRLQYALARDGLLPSLFGEIDAKGNLWNGALISGTIMTLIATFVPFQYLNDLISSGILVAFTMTNWALVSLRCDSLSLSPPTSYMLQYLLSIFNVVSFVTGLIITHSTNTMIGKILSSLGCFTLVTVMLMISRHCYGGDLDNNIESDRGSDDYFEIPFVPYLPCFGMFLNWYLIAQMELVGILLLAVYLSVAALVYFCYGVKHSVGSTTGWR
jgi:APA family basic amino acid/polyamine antiporter